MQGLPLAHYFEISLYRIQPGKEGDFADFIAARKTAKDGVDMDRPEIAYQVISGAPPQTFIFLGPLDSLSSLDEGLPRLPIYARAVAKAAGKIATEAEFRSEEMLFRVAPDLSYVSDEFSAADRGFAELSSGGADSMSVMENKPLKTETLDFYTAYGSFVLYRILRRLGRKDDHSYYLPKTAFPNPAGPYLDNVLMTITVSPTAKWNRT